MIQQTTNKAYVTGLLKEKKIELKKSKNGKQMAIGHLIVIVNNAYGKGEIKVKLMQMAIKKDGKENSLYKALENIANTYKASIDVGEENADTIKIEGSLNDETYFSAKKGDFVELALVKALFITRTEKNTEHCCKVAFEGYVSKITPVDSQLEIDVVGLGYEQIAFPLKVTIPEKLVGQFNTSYNVGATGTFNFNIVNHIETILVQDNVSFGENLGEEIRKTTTKKIVFGGSAANYQGLTQDIIRKGMALREGNLEKKKQETLSSAGDNMSAGFGGGAVNVNDTGFANMDFGGMGNGF